ncbi:PREDICTED: uncharacterized protein LOC108558339 isoform X2 [Nicrophorus vespilloides]|uniref:Uncharacterized protein LOC108558339 isoform X2 n=1 Tax=Nicrophorus vespilloides TaxID=110193 RepID=A0ABM1M821_NICVS|nr:PREDICTED: uncharacterized protein LOC108558339 isoform X2 [Nicrophorus vespilloides]
MCEKYLPAKIRKISENFSIETIDRPVRVRNFAGGTMGQDQNGNSVLPIGSKTYISKCYFQSKAIPIKYSETVIVKLGSRKKKYFESVYCQTKAVPYRWSETMLAQMGGEVHKSEMVVRREEECHYIALPQDNLDNIASIEAKENLI